MCKPNFFIVGGPKCGTTAIWSYLKTHPAVFLCEPKEPFFLAPDIWLPQYCDFKTWPDYFQLFASVQPQHRVIGEASVIYLYSQVAVPTIRDHFPGAKLLVMLRNPMDAFPSFHSQLFLAWIENVANPQRAWELQSLRRRGSQIPPACMSPRSLLYKDVLSFGKQLRRLWDSYPKDLVHVELFDDFISNPRECYLRILSFLGVEDDGRTEFPKVNERRALRVSPVIFRLWYYQNIPLRFRLAGRVIGLHHLHRFISERLFITKAAPRPLSPDFRQLLEDEFREDILLLQELLGRDLSHWFQYAHGSAQPDQSDDHRDVENEKAEVRHK